MSRLNIILIAITVFAGAALMYSTIQWVSARRVERSLTGVAYRRAVAAEDPTDKCATPSGYTAEEWLEHMSHHPEQYQGCL